jgi:hypothetical protein
VASPRTTHGSATLPFKNTADYRGAIWYDQPRSGDLVDAMTMQSTYRYPFDPPLVFEYVRGEEAYLDIPRTAPPSNM